MGAFHQGIEVGERAEDRVHRQMVGHVVAEILLRGGEERAQPDGVHAQAGDVAELRGDAGQIADAVAVGVEEAARIDLIDDGAAPPLLLFHGRTVSPPRSLYAVSLRTSSEVHGAAMARLWL